MQGAQVPSLIGELRPHMLHGTAKKKKKIESDQSRPQDSEPVWTDWSSRQRRNNLGINKDKSYDGLTHIRYISIHKFHNDAQQKEQKTTLDTFGECSGISSLFWNLISKGEELSLFLFPIQPDFRVIQ